MSERSEERPGPDIDTVRETMQERDEETEDAQAGAEEFEQDPSRNPDDENLEGLKGG